MNEKFNFVHVMINFNLILPEVQTFFRENLHQNPATISLKKSLFSGINSTEIAQQIKGLKIAKSKFPLMFDHPRIIYPPSLHLEQASSYPTAMYKSQRYSGQNIIDLTAGMGIDAYAFAQSFEQVTALEKNESLAEISAFNYQQLAQTNLNYVTTSFETFLEENADQKWDMIYLDPARRKNSQKKFLLEDLEPNILVWMDVFFRHSDRVLIKLSPLFDLKLAMEKIPQIHEIHLVAVKNEMKELLLYCEKNNSKLTKIYAVNLLSGQDPFEFDFLAEENASVQYSAPENYLYEPNSALMKAGAFKLIAKRFSIKKLHPNTHLYTSEKLIPNFPGKTYLILDKIVDVKKTLQNQAFHVVSKNHPLTVPAIRKKYKIKESENLSVFFTQSIEGKTVFTAQKQSFFAPSADE